MTRKKTAERRMLVVQEVGSFALQSEALRRYTEIK